MSAHAKLSPSAADRWATCTKSLEMEAGLTEQESSYAREGTEAHDLLERAVIAKTQPSILEPDHHAARDVDHCYWLVEKYLDDPRYTVLTEVKLNLVTDCWGTADLVVIDHKKLTIHVIDYKHGRGVVVEPDCLQLLIYSVAALNSLSWMMDDQPKKLIATICQPRAAHSDGPIRTHEYLRNDAVNRCEREVIEAINLINSDNTELYPSEKACKWCKAAANCPALAKQALDGVSAYFSDTGLLEVSAVDDVVLFSIEKKAAVMEARGLLKTFLGAIESDVENILKSGGTVPGFKLVAGRSNRKFIGSEEDVKEFCRNELKLKPFQFTETKLLGPAKIEKLINVKKRGGKKKLELFQAHIEKPEGKPTIVPESDKRPNMAGHFQQVTNPLA